MGYPGTAEYVLETELGSPERVTSNKPVPIHQPCPTCPLDSLLQMRLHSAAVVHTARNRASHHLFRRGANDVGVRARNPARSSPFNW